MKLFILGGLLITASLFLHAQIPVCGSDLSLLSEKEQKAALDFYSRDLPPISKDDAEDSVAITAHIVRFSSAGFGDLTQEDIDSEIEKANKVYSGAGIVFFLCGSPRQIRGKTVYDFNSGDELNRQNYVPNTINVYFVEDLQVNVNFGLCGYAQFPWIGDVKSRYIMMNQACSTDGATLSHELGHFYGLFHTHETFRGREYVDGSNCETAGDQICDTPADPNLSLPNAMSGCLYVGRYTDPKGELYGPSVSNLMAYSPSPCQRNFTEGQRKVMRAVHENENAYLTGRCDFYPDFSAGTKLKELTIRSDEDFSIDYTFDYIGVEEEYEAELKISLSDAPDEIGLLLHREKVLIQPGQTSVSKRFDLDFPITRGTGVYYLIAEIDSERKVIERTERNNKAYTIITVDNTSLENVLIFPNPAVDEVKLFFRNDKVKGAFKIRIFGYDGRFYRQVEGFKNRDEYFQLLEVGALQPGLYILRVDFELSNTEYTFKFLKK